MFVVKPSVNAKPNGIKILYCGYFVPARVFRNSFLIRCKNIEAPLIPLGTLSEGITVACHSKKLMVKSWLFLKLRAS